ncbi:uncharacterized protein LOC134540079 isoform X2 [Bacillus rossius redtenbacheri]|uniref:uncharacterized protein LOC134540079 isoform X2 n=1 Tax=Bacillus rossius redtenbacheri TaxID=93214 RepID=UPI002FDE7FDD
MRIRKAEISIRGKNRKRKFRRSFPKIWNRIKRSRVFYAMNADMSSDVISLIDDEENVSSQSTVGRSVVLRGSQETKRGPRGRCGWMRKPNSQVTNIVDLSTDQELECCASQSRRQRKRKAAVLGVGDEIGIRKKLKVMNKPVTVVSDVGDEVKILGLNTGSVSSKISNSNDVEMLPPEKNSSLLKTEKAKPTTSMERVQDKPSLDQEQETNDSVIILEDSDDESTEVVNPNSGCNYIPLARKRLNSSIEVLDHIRGTPQSAELLVVKHIAPPSQSSSKQSNEAVTMFEDRTGNSEQFYTPDFWKTLKNRHANGQSKKKKLGCVGVKMQSKPVKQRDDSNIYNPSPVCEKGGLRPIIIDGNNVAWGHGNHKYFSASGLEICIKYFDQRKHRVIAFVPQYRKTSKVPGLMDMLDKYEKLGQIVITPSRIIDGKSVSSYDDRYIVQAATELGGVIVSTDNYRDLMAENQRWKETIEKRLLMFTWVGDMLMFPQDPLGRNGPTLEEFLRFPD